MAYKVRFTMTRPNTDVDWVTNMGVQEADQGLVPGYATSNGGTIDLDAPDDVTRTVTYTFPAQANWQAFYNQALPVWNRNNLVEGANNASISIDVEVLENT